jgi:hypothetical protein
MISMKKQGMMKQYIVTKLNIAVEEGRDEAVLRDEVVWTVQH